MSRVLHRSVQLQPQRAVSGRGIRVTLADGRIVMDASGGAAVACIGHGNERVAKAIGEQAGKMAYAHTAFFSSDPAEELAELLVGHEPGGLSHAFFVSSGSEAVEACIKLARQFFVEIGEPERTRFIGRRQSYHGNTLGALAAGGHPGRRRIYEPLLSTNFSHVSPCFPYHYKDEGESDTAYVRRLADELEAEFQRLGPRNVIAFVAEPIVGAASGCTTAVPGYFPAMKAVCERHGALLILDEIMSGMGRSGSQHVWQQEGVTPDIQAIAKGLGGGYVPIGAMLASGRVIEGLSRGSGAFVHGHTYQGHPLACAGALEVQRIIREDKLIENVARLGPVLHGALAERFGSHPHVGEIRGRGFFWALEFVRDRDAREPFAPSVNFTEHLKAAALDSGILVYPSSGTVDGVRGDHAIVAPPFNTTAGEIAEIVDRLGTTVDKTLAAI